MTLFSLLETTTTTEKRGQILKISLKTDEYYIFKNVLQSGNAVRFRVESHYVTALVDE